MRHPHITQLLFAQDGTLSTWQLLRAGHTAEAVRHAVKDLREVHDGVHVSGHTELTDRQRFWAAVLTAPGSVLSHASAGILHEFYERRSLMEVVTRAGDGGPKQFGGVLVCRSTRLGADVMHDRGLPVMSPARTVLDLIAHSGPVRADRIVRDALRTGAVADADLLMIIGRHRGRRGVAKLRLLAREYEGLPARRARSDAELLALAILRSAGVALPALNVKRAGHEADLSWPDLRRIIELDGGSFHRFSSHDARIQRRWERAGWRVDRLPTDDVYDRPDRLLALAPAPIHPPRRANGRLLLP